MKLSPKKLFLLDGSGALLSAFMLGIVLVRLEVYIGMPVDILYFLAALAILFSIYSFSCYAINPSRWKLFLKIIASVNALYCLLTLFLTVYLLDDLTTLGITYFFLEVVVILFLIRLEWRFASGKMK